MTGNELEAARRLLFFSPPEAAALISGTSEQAWRRWEAGTRAVPADVAEAMSELLAWRGAAIDASLGKIDTLPADTTLALVWYDTLDDWSTVPGREPHLWRPQQSVCAALYSMRRDRLQLVRFDAPAFAGWLAGRADSEAMRGQWAASLAATAAG